MSSPQSNYPDDRGNWFAGEGQPYPTPHWESRSDNDGAQPSVHYPQQLPYEEPSRVAREAPEREDLSRGDGSPSSADRDWPRGDPELAAVVRREAGNRTDEADARGYGTESAHQGGGHMDGSQHHAAHGTQAGAAAAYGAGQSVDPPTSQVPTFAANQAPPGRPAEAGVPPVLASMMQPGATGAHQAQAVPQRRPDQVADGTYRTKRPGSAVLVVLVTLLFAMPPLVLLSRSVLETGSASGVIGGLLVLLGLPLFAMGLHPLLGGGAETGAREVTALLRPPYLYLVLGLVLLVGAGLAAG